VVVPNQLPACAAGVGKAHSINDVVNSSFENADQVLTSNTFGPISFFETIGELAFQDTVDSPYFLFLSQMPCVLRSLVSTLPMLSRAIRSSFKRTLIRKASLPLKEELYTFTSAQFANRAIITRHLIPPAAL
jgi:hypothetical protein